MNTTITLPTHAPTDDEIDALLHWLTERRLDHTEFPSVSIQVASPPRRAGGAAIVEVWGTTPSGTVELISVVAGPPDRRGFWLELLHSLRARGLSGVAEVNTDDHRGVRRAVELMFPRAQLAHAA